jgi:histidinol-phosphatase (PHP family)
MEECIDSAISRGIKEMCITDHTDLEFPAHGDLVFDYSKYCSSIENISHKKGGKIKINKGVEIGLQDHLPPRLDKFFEDREFDFVIGSIHVVDKKDIVYDEYFNGRSQSEAYSNYFSYLYKCIKGFDNFDVLGHLDIIKRYGPYIDKKLQYGDYSDMIDTILKELISRGKGIEINTSGVRYKLDTYHPSVEILKAYKRLGGEIKPQVRTAIKRSIWHMILKTLMSFSGHVGLTI